MPEERSQDIEGVLIVVDDEDAEIVEEIAGKAPRTLMLERRVSEQPARRLRHCVDVPPSTLSSRRHQRKPEKVFPAVCTTPRAHHGLREDSDTLKKQRVPPSLTRSARPSTAYSGAIWWRTS